MKLSPISFPTSPLSCTVSIPNHTSSLPICPSAFVSPLSLARFWKRSSSCTHSEFFGINGVLRSKLLYPHCMWHSRPRNCMEHGSISRCGGARSSSWIWKRTAKNNFTLYYFDHRLISASRSYFPGAILDHDWFFPFPCPNIQIVFR